MVIFFMIGHVGYAAPAKPGGGAVVLARPEDETLTNAIETFLRDDWREFLLVGFIILLLTMLIRVVASMRMMFDLSARRRAWFEVFCVGCDLCLLAVGGSLVLARFLDTNARAGQHEGVTLCAIGALVLLLLAAVVSAFSTRTVDRLIFSGDALLSMHVPNGIGLVAVFLVATVMRG